MANVNDKLSANNMFEAPELHFGHLSRKADKDCFPSKEEMTGKE